MQNSQKEMTRPRFVFLYQQPYHNLIAETIYSLLLCKWFAFSERTNTCSELWFEYIVRTTHFILSFLIIQQV